MTGPQLFPMTADERFAATRGILSAEVERREKSVESAGEKLDEAVEALASFDAAVREVGERLRAAEDNEAAT